MSKLVIKFFAPVNEQTANKLMNVIDEAVNNGIKEIVLLISTPGGSVFHGLSIYNYLKGLPVDKITTHNFGSVDSIGVVIYAAGTERFSSPQARFLIHGVSANFQGQFSLEEPQLEERLKGLRIDIENIAKVISVNVGKTEDEVVSAMIDRTTLNPEEAIKWGLVHEIRTELFTSGVQVVSITT
ncbi:ATP-dependent Clp protease proteolytic subunit [Candidatus Wolfebacteria bacterium]|nr:ATP-dependent Clp protease proteolytic subunit [Candidatus Wolfebacteria bacterium]